MPDLPPALKRTNSIMPRQIYGWTGMHIPGETYVRFIMAFENSDGSITFTIRNGKGEENRIDMPPEGATDLALAVLLSGPCREHAHARIPKLAEEQS